MKVNISEIVESMDMQSMEFTSFLNRKTGKIIGVMDEDFRSIDRAYEDPELMSENEVKVFKELGDFLEGEDAVKLPTSFDLNEYDIMEDFINSLDNDFVRSQLSNAINGKGAFRRFKDRAFDLDVIEDWYKFKENSYKSIAIEWCKDNDIKFEDK